MRQWLLFLPLVFLPSLLVMPSHALGQSNLYSNITVQMVICNHKVAPDQCTKSWVGPNGTQFTSNAFTLVILTPVEVHTQDDQDYFFQHWEDGSTNATRFVWNFQPNMTMTATYGFRQINTGLADIAIGSAAGLTVTVFTAYMVKSAREKRRRLRKR